MLRLSFLYLVLITIANFPRENEACQHCHMTKKASTRGTYGSEDGTNDMLYALTGHAYASKSVGDVVEYFAAHASLPGKPSDEYYGVVATIDVYGYNISRGQLSASTVWVYNVGNWSKENYNSIRIGWMVSPDRYGDSHTHFYTYWRRDGYARSGCYDMDCPGFQLLAGSKLTPGAIIKSVSTIGGPRHTITVKVFKEKSSEKWWLYCGINDETPTAVGYYPANIFTTLAAKANAIAFGGESAAARSFPTPPMGSGSLPSEKAASISNLQFVDQDGQATLIQSDLQIFADHPKCYYVSPIIGSKFSFGGPPGCF